MSIKNGYVKIYRALLDWEWYDDLKTLKLFIHLLLTANYEDFQWHGIGIKRGQRVASISTLAYETKLSPKSIRTSLNKLKKTNEVGIETTNKYTLITIVNYALYQDSNEKMANKTANKVENKGQINGNNERRNEKENNYTLKFEEFYSEYPNSKEKQRTFSNWTTALRFNTAEELINAAKNYAVEVSNREKKYIKTSANFLGKEKPYIDYIEINKPKPLKREVIIEEISI